MLRQSFKLAIRNCKKSKILPQLQNNPSLNPSIGSVIRKNNNEIQCVFLHSTRATKKVDDRPDAFRYSEESVNLSDTNGENTTESAQSKIEISSSSFHRISGDKIISIANALDSTLIGTIEDVQIREACQALKIMAHFKVEPPTVTGWKSYAEGGGATNVEKKWGVNTRGELGWRILKRLLLEAGATFEKEDVRFNLQAMQQEGSSFPIDSSVYHDTIKCMTSSKQPLLILAADNLLMELEKYYLQTKSDLVLPVGRSYALLLDSIKDVESDDIKLATRVKSIMKRYQTQHEAGNKQVVVNPQLYNSALNALASHSSKTSKTNPTLAKIVQEMILDPEAQLDLASFSIAMKSLLASNKWSDILDPSTGLTTANAIEKILLQMQNRGLGHPNVKIMTPILHALSNEGNIDEIMNLLEWMEEMYESRGWEDIRPNNYHFNNMITALTRSSSDGKVRSGSGHLAIEILNKMKMMYEEGGNEDVRPDLITYNAVLNAIAKEENPQGMRRVNNDIVERAEALLQQMENGEEGEHITPDVFSYNSVLTAFMNSSISDAATKAKKLLEHMEERDVQPDLVSYTICINTLSKSKLDGAAQSAEDLLHLLEENYANGNEGLKPDVTCYNSGKYILI